jgi:hypothetical protein
MSIPDHKRNAHCGEVGPDGRCARCGRRITGRVPRWALAATVTLGLLIAWLLARLAA